MVIDSNSTDYIFEGAHHPAESCLHGREHTLDIIPKAQPPIEGPRVFLTKPQSGVESLDCTVGFGIYDVPSPAIPDSIAVLDTTVSRVDQDISISLRERLHHRAQVRRVVCLSWGDDSGAYHAM